MQNKDIIHALHTPVVMPVWVSLVFDNAPKGWSLATVKVLRVLFKYFSDEFSICAPSIRRIAREASVDPSTVNAVLAKLERDAYIRHQKNGSPFGMEWKTNVYHLTPKLLELLTQNTSGDASAQEESDARKRGWVLSETGEGRRAATILTAYKYIPSKIPEVLNQESESKAKGTEQDKTDPEGSNTDFEKRESEVLESEILKDGEKESRIIGGITVCQCQEKPRHRDNLKATSGGDEALEGLSKSNKTIVADNGFEYEENWIPSAKRINASTGQISTLARFGIDGGGMTMWEANLAIQGHCAGVKQKRQEAKARNEQTKARNLEKRLAFQKRGEEMKNQRLTLAQYETMLAYGLVSESYENCHLSIKAASEKIKKSIEGGSIKNRDKVLSFLRACGESRPAVTIPKWQARQADALIENYGEREALRYVEWSKENWQHLIETTRGCREFSGKFNLNEATAPWCIKIWMERFRNFSVKVRQNSGTRASKKVPQMMTQKEAQLFKEVEKLREQIEEFREQIKELKKPLDETKRKEAVEDERFFNRFGDGVVSDDVESNFENDEVGRDNEDYESGRYGKSDLI